jgi:thiol:disulfide interchange protein DsbD
VLVNMTASWCITCLANERVTLSSDTVKNRLHASGVTYLKGDWTHRDAEITAYLAQFGRNGVPLYVLYPRGGGAPEVLPQILTPNIVDEALQRAAASPPTVASLP